MFLRSLLKSKKGSTLLLCILIMIIMALLGISLITVTISSMKMSIFYNDLEKAYSLAEAAAEEIISNVDKKVADIQEVSRQQASEDLKDQLRLNPISLRDPEGNISLATSSPDNVSKLEDEYESKYFSYFSSELDNEFGDVASLDKMKELLGATEVDGSSVFKDLEPDKGRLILKSAQYDSANQRMNIRVVGEYNGYKKELEVGLDLLAESDNTPYQPITKSTIKNPVKYDLLKKAIVTEKNLIAVGGNIEITGDVLSFGTIPVIDDTLNPDEQVEDKNAPWNRYGGLIVGMCEDVANESDELGFDRSKTGDYSNASLTINGDAATMAYIHSVYSTSVDQSSLSISGDSFTRSLRSEKRSSYATLNLNNLSTIDNLQIDSSGTVVNINGVYKGFVDTWHAIDGSSESTFTAEDESIPKRTSSVVVNGDSMLNFMDAVYIGGSTFLKNVTDAGKPYMTGISALKSTRRIKNAFVKDDISNPSNYLFWYDSGAYVEPYDTPSFKSYTTGEEAIDMFSGRASDPDYFPIINRAMHFKKVWTDLWSSDPNGIFSTYVNPDSINIATTTEGKLKGYSNGLLIANGTVYDCYEFDEMHDPSSFQLNIRKPSIETYYSQISGLLKEPYNEEIPRLNFALPTKNIKEYFDNDFVGTNRIEINRPYVSADSNLGFVYYGDSDVHIKEEGGVWKIDPGLGNSYIVDRPSDKGIIYVDGNIYVDNGFNFTGILMSSKNVVFLGNANVTYDQNTIDSLLKADVNINGFFGLLTFEIPYETLKSQRISTKNTNIVKWNEIE